MSIQKDLTNIHIKKRGQVAIFKMSIQKNLANIHIQKRRIPFFRERVRVDANWKYPDSDRRGRAPNRRRGRLKSQYATNGLQIVPRIGVRLG